MKISVCIPTYNSERFIGACLESVFAQTYDDFEVVVSDNASTDRTWQILQSFTDRRMRVFRVKENRGMVYNFNRLLELAGGEYVKILCCDDVLSPEALQFQSKFLDEYREVVMVTCDRNIVDAAGRPDQMVRWFPEVVFLRPVDLKILTLLYGNIVGEPSATLIRRTSVERTGPFEEGWSTLVDLDMWLRLSDQGLIAYLPKPLCMIRRHDSSMSSQFHSAGVVEESVWRLARRLLGGLDAGLSVKKICWGKVAGSYLRQTRRRLMAGDFPSALSFCRRGFEIDPCFFGLLAYLSLFRHGLLGLRADHKDRVRICAGSTLRWVS